MASFLSALIRASLVTLFLILLLISEGTSLRAQDDSGSTPSTPEPQTESSTSENEDPAASNLDSLKKQLNELQKEIDKIDKKAREDSDLKEATSLVKDARLAYQQALVDAANAIDPSAGELMNEQKRIKTTVEDKSDRRKQLREVDDKLQPILTQAKEDPAVVEMAQKKKAAEEKHQEVYALTLEKIDPAAKDLLNTRKSLQSEIWALIQKKRSHAGQKETTREEERSADSTSNIQETPTQASADLSGDSDDEEKPNEGLSQEERVASSPTPEFAFDPGYGKIVVIVLTSIIFGSWGFAAFKRKV